MKCRPNTRVGMLAAVWMLAVGCGAPPVSQETPAASVEPTESAPPAPAGDERLLEQLPPGAPVYVIARPSAIISFVASRPEAALFLDNLEVGTIEQAGLDVTRHIAFAGLFVDAEAANRAFDAFESEIQRGADVGDAFERAGPHPGWRGRVVVPLKRESAIESLVALVPGLRVVRCPGQGCAQGATAMVLGDGLRAVVKMEGETALVDAAIETQANGPPLGSGGPTRGCRDLDQGAALALCVDPDGLATAAAAQARFKVIEAVTLSGVSSLTRAQLTKLLATGKAEADVVKRLSERGAGLITDFELAIGLGAGTVEGRASWGMTPALKQHVERVVSAPMQFSTVSELRASALEPLHRELGSDPAIAAPISKEGLRNELQAGGWPATLMTLVRAWPVLIASRSYAEFAAELDQPIPELKQLRLELAIQGDHLVLRWQFALP